MTSRDRPGPGAPDPLRRGPGSPDDDVDPTGVRAILAGLPDPGPMPADLIERINASLATEQSERAGAAARAGRTDRAGLEHPGVKQSVASGASVSSLEAARQRRGRMLSRLPIVAVAASGAVIAGVVAINLLSGGDEMTSADAHLPTTTISNDAEISSNDPAAGSAADDFAAEESATGDSTAEAPAADTARSGTDSPDDDRAATETTDATGEVAAEMAPTRPGLVLTSGATLSPASVPEHAVALRDGSPTVHGAPEPDDAVLATSPLATVAGAADCLLGLIRSPGEALPERVAAIDFVHLDDEPAALIVLLDTAAAIDGGGLTAGSGAGEPGVAYVVDRDCDAESGTLLTDPVLLP
ncbi:MAG: hypothetical protein Q4G67_02940 [Actinomycetia bacterium]|nr:hypothetical protein [Actinomycetes bacterium]